MEFIRPKRSSFHIQLSPLIDVLFILLVFFMLSSSFIKSAVDIQLPKAAASKPIETKNALLTIDKVGGLTFSNESVSFTDLSVRLLSFYQNKEEKVLDLQADKELAYETFLQVVTEVKQAGVSQFNLVHEQTK